MPKGTQDARFELYHELGHIFDKAYVTGKDIYGFSRVWGMKPPAPTQLGQWWVPAGNDASRNILTSPAERFARYYADLAANDPSMNWARANDVLQMFDANAKQRAKALGGMKWTDNLLWRAYDAGNGHNPLMSTYEDRVREARMEEIDERLERRGVDCEGCGYRWIPGRQCCPLCDGAIKEQ